MRDEAEIEPKNNAGQRKKWNVATHTRVVEKYSRVAHNNVDIFQVEVPGDYLIRKSEYPNGVTILNELPRPTHDEIEDTEEDENITFEPRYYLPGEEPETLVYIQGDTGWPSGKVIIWKLGQ